MALSDCYTKLSTILLDCLYLELQELHALSVTLTFLRLYVVYEEYRNIALIINHSYLLCLILDML